MLTIRIEEKVEIEKLITLNEILDKENFLISVIIESENSLLDNKVSVSMFFRIYQMSLN